MIVNLDWFENESDLIDVRYSRVSYVSPAINRISIVHVAIK